VRAVQLFLLVEVACGFDLAFTLMGTVIEGIFCRIWMFAFAVRAHPTLLCNSGKMAFDPVPLNSTESRICKEEHQYNGCTLFPADSDCGVTHGGVIGVLIPLAWAKPIGGFGTVHPVPKIEASFHPSNSKRRLRISRAEFTLVRPSIAVMETASSRSGGHTSPHAPEATW